MSRVVVTGASGFIGQALCPLLRARGHEVVEPDRTALHDMPARIGGAQAIVHLAALAHARGVDDKTLRKVNVELPVTVGRAAAAVGAHLIFMSTVKVLGESSAFPLNESAPLKPADPYARAKAEAETKLRAIPGLALTVLRPPLVYGPGVKANFLALMSAIARGWPLPLSGIANRRSLLYVGNLADAIVRCLNSLPGKTFLLSDGPPVSTTELCQGIAAALNRPARLFSMPRALLGLVPGTASLTQSLEVDDGAIRRELGWAPPHTAEEGLRRTAEWFLSRG